MKIPADCIIKENSIRFIIISVLPEPVRSDITAICREFREITGSETALLYPPHITLRTGAIVPVDKVSAYTEGFTENVKFFKTKTVYKEAIRIDKPEWIDYYEEGIRKHLVFFPVDKTEWTSELNTALLAYNHFIKSNSADFKPHISLAYGDLDSTGFIELQKKITQNTKRYKLNCSFELPGVSLYYQSLNGLWNEYITIEL